MMHSQESSRTNRRVSLTKTQRQTAVGVELLSLCQTVTADGSLSEEEVQLLRDWLNDNRDFDLPAVSYLSPIAERIIADGVATPDERLELFLALEKVLPQDIREMSRTARRARVQEERERTKLEAQAEKLKQREERERNRPIEHFDFMVAGAKYEGRPEVIAERLRAPDPVVLSRDPANRYSRNAVRILTTEGYQIGFVPEEDAAELAPLLDSHHPYVARVKKILAGRTHDIPVVIADLYRKDASVPDAMRPNAVFESIVAEPRAGDSTGRSNSRVVAKTITALVALLLLVFMVRSCDG